MPVILVQPGSFRMPTNATIDGSRLARLLFVLLVLLAPVAVGCGGETEQGGTTDDAAAAEKVSSSDDAKNDENATEAEDEGEAEEKHSRERSVSVTAAPVTRGELVIPVVAEGSVRARHSTEIKFEVAGRIDKVLVQEGERVRKGQTLAVLDDREFRISVEEAHTRYLQALSQLAVEEDDIGASGDTRPLDEQLEELRSLEAQGKITRKEREDREVELGVNAIKNGKYRREILEVRTGLSTARADEGRARLDLERTVLHAPFTGVVASLDLTAGERVTIGQVFCRLVDDVNLEAEVGVLESDLAVLEVDRPALLYVPALGDEFSMPVKVDVISPDINDASRTCRVLMRLKSEDGRVKPGMFVRAAIAGQIFSDRLLVPREAILTRDGRPMLFRVENDRAKWVYVQVGRRNDHLVEIEKVLQGGPLDEGTLVVVDNHLTLTHDAKIKVTKTMEALDPWAAYAQSE
jgi:RND family efflux transporter MFP subunit